MMAHTARSLETRPLLIQRWPRQPCCCSNHEGTRVSCAAGAEAGGGVERVHDEHSKSHPGPPE